VDQAGSHFMLWNFRKDFGSHFRSRLPSLSMTSQSYQFFSAALVGHGSSNISADTSWHLEIDLKNFFN